MRQVLPYPLWLGHAGAGRDFRAVLYAGIVALVQVAAEEPALQPPHNLIYCRFPLLDGNGNDLKVLSLATTTVANLLEKRIPTLLFCGAGLSRSPAVAAAALAMVYQDGPDDYLKQITEHYPADVVPGFWNEIKGVLDERL